MAFSSDEDNAEKLTKQIERMIKKQFDLNIPVFVISREGLEDILRTAPDWWGIKNKKMRAIGCRRFSGISLFYHMDAFRICLHQHIPQWLRERHGQPLKLCRVSLFQLFGFYIFCRNIFFLLFQKNSFFILLFIVF